MTRRSPVRSALAACLTAAALLTAGCATAPASDAAATTGAEHPSISPHPAHTVGETTVPAPPVGSAVDGTKFGARLLAAITDRRSFRTTTSQPTAHGHGSYDVTGAGSGIQHLTIDAIGTLTARMIGHTLWVKGWPHASTPWVIANSKAPANATAALLTSVVGPAKMNTLHLYRAVDGVTGKVVTGTTSPSHTVTTHYRFAVPAEKYLAEFGPAGKGILGAALTGTVTIDFYITLHGLPDTVVVHSTSKLTGTTMAHTITYSDWGVAVRVQKPPAGQVGPPPKLIDDSVMP